MAFGAIGIGAALTLGKPCPPGDPDRSAEIGGIRRAALLGNHHLAPGSQATGGAAHILHAAGESIGEQATGGLRGAGLRAAGVIAALTGIVLIGID